MAHKMTEEITCDGCSRVIYLKVDDEVKKDDLFWELSGNLRRNSDDEVKDQMVPRLLCMDCGNKQHLLRTNEPNALHTLRRVAERAET